MDRLTKIQNSYLIIYYFSYPLIIQNRLVNVYIIGVCIFEVCMCAESAWSWCLHFTNNANCFSIHVRGQTLFIIRISCLAIPFTLVIFNRRERDRMMRTLYFRIAAWLGHDWWRATGLACFLFIIISDVPNSNKEICDNLRIWLNI